MPPIFIAFGANLSNPKSTFDQAVTLLEGHGVHLVKMSSLWQSPAWPPGSEAPDYLNAVAEITFVGTPQALMSRLLEVETQLGRVRSVKNAPRTLDLDLLVWGRQSKASEHLTLPHPRMLQRAFVLLPLYEIAPDWTDQVHDMTAMQHLSRLQLSDVMALSRVRP